MFWNGWAVISYSVSRDSGRSWSYGGVALREPFHLSYPCVFWDNGTPYMIPEVPLYLMLAIERCDGVVMIVMATTMSMMATSMMMMMGDG